MEREYGRAYERLYREHWWWRAREEFLLRLLRKLPLPKPTRVLDVGCGNGLFFDALEGLGFEVEGLESEAALVDSDGGRRIHIGPFDRRFVPNKQFSLILMLDVLEHLPQPESALEYAAELLEPGGYLVVTVPSFMCLWTTHDVVNHHYIRYTKSTLRRTAIHVPMDFVDLRYFFHWLAALKLVVRIKERLIATRPTAPSVPSRMVNRLMLSGCRLEQRVCDCLGSPPFGSSLLAISRKR